MNELTRLLVLLGIAGVAVTLLASLVRWQMNEGRRIRRGLKAVLKDDAHGYLVALGRGCGLGFNFTRNQVAVVWDSGAWGFVYALDELMGAELIVDTAVVGRVHRGEARRALDVFSATERVALRLVFDDPGQPDFILDLWLPEDEDRRDELPPGEAIAEANRWLARIEALLRRPVTTRRASPPTSAPPHSTPTVAQPAAVEPAQSAPWPQQPLFYPDNDEVDEDHDDAAIR